MISPHAPKFRTAPPAPERVARPVLLLSLVTGGLLGLMALVFVWALQLHFESGDRERLSGHLQAARQLIATVDNTAALAALPALLNATFSDERDVAVRVQGGGNQPLFEQGQRAAIPDALLARPSAVAQPGPLVTWVQDGRTWRGAALRQRMPMDGSAPLTVAVAIDIEAHAGFVVRLRWVLLGYVLLATLGFAGVAHRVLRGG